MLTVLLVVLVVLVLGVVVVLVVSVLVVGLVVLVLGVVVVLAVVVVIIVHGLYGAVVDAEHGRAVLGAVGQCLPARVDAIAGLEGGVGRGIPGRDRAGRAGVGRVEGLPATADAVVRGGVVLRDVKAAEGQQGEDGDHEYGGGDRESCVGGPVQKLVPLVHWFLNLTVAVRVSRLPGAAGSSATRVMSTLASRVGSVVGWPAASK